MVIAVLDENLIAQIRSSSSIDSVTQCVTELVLNSLDAKSSSIAIRVNLNTFRIQVVDNGRGISHSNLESVGIRYMTNKCHTLDDLKKHLKYYGFKGEALANISKISQKVTITTREENCEETYEKIIENDHHKVDSTKSRPSSGTTVTIDGFLHNLPVRQHCVKTNELDNVKRSIESLIIIHPRVSFTLRNDLGARLILSSTKCPDIASSFKTIHPEIEDNDFAFIKVSKKKISVDGIIHKDFNESKRFQYVYVNKRPILCPKVQNLLNLSLRKSRSGDDKKKFPVFVIHIKCPYSDIDISLEPSKTVVFFKKFDTVKKCIEKMLNTFLGGKIPQDIVQKKRQKNGASEFGLSQIDGVVKGFATKRKNENFEEVSVNSAKIIDDTPVFEEPRIPTKHAKMALPIEIKKSEKNIENVADDSLFTNFPENEETGKNVIMDMFIMSLKVFPAETTENEQNNHEYVEEMSPLLSPNKVSLGVQTTPNAGGPTKEKMVSVGVQTGGFLEQDFTLFPRKSLTKYVSDYDFDFSKIDTVPMFNFNKCDTTPPIFVNLDQTKKLFDFRNKGASNFNGLGNFKQPSEYQFKEVCLPCAKISPIFDGKFETKRHDFCSKQIDIVQSPYFAKKPKKHSSPQDVILCTCHQLNKSCEDLDTITYHDNIDNNPWRKNLEVTFIKNDNQKKRLNESSISKYFTPKKPRTFKTPNSPFPKSQPKRASFEQSKDLFAFSNSSEESHLSITIDETVKENKKPKFSENFLAPTLTLPSNQWAKDLKPKLKKDASFEMLERIDFVPKGLSPILKDYGKVDDMSPESKTKLQNALIESYEDELLLVKWQNCLECRDPKRFFEEIYLEKSKLIESSIPTINKNGYTKNLKGFENMTFSKSFLKNLEVIGQLDCKFIIAMEKTKNLMVLFDQHAVHERVRLEELSESYKNATTKLDQSVTIFVPQSDLVLLQRQKSTLKLLGLNLDFFTNGLTVLNVPLCIYNKSKKGVDIVSLTEALIQEIIETVKTNNGIIVSTPKVIQNIVNSEACRGAIKFGDSLSRNESVLHLKKLANCKLPFQCAHGRPTLTPLINLNKSHESFSAKPRLRNLKY